MAMVETDRMTGWDKHKDGWTDGSANFGLFNMNEDFLNSIRNDINDPKLGAGIDDPVSNLDDRGMAFWYDLFNVTKEPVYYGEGDLRSQFTEGQFNLTKQLKYLKASFDIWV